MLARLLLVACLASGAFAAQAPRPNILYLYVDDLGWGSIGPNGQAERRAKGLPTVKTPNLDRLAAEGMNFTRGYGCHVCSPARSSQQTGFHQGHTFADRNDPNNAKKAIRAEDITMGDALSAAGYTTGYWGKWGYGGSKDMAAPTIDNVQTLPTSHGYRHVLAELHHVRAHTFFQPTLWSAPAKPGAKGGLELKPNTLAWAKGDSSYPSHATKHDDPTYPKTAYCDDVYAFAALDFVRAGAKAYRKDKTPFFGLFAPQIPHAPFDEIAKLPGWNAAYADDPTFNEHPKQAQQWAAMVTRIDAHFGMLLDALEDPDGDGEKSDSVARDTLVVFQSDNGGPGGTNNPTFDSNGGLRGTKGSIHEGGIRVPLLMRWPARVPATTESHFPICVSDLLPTFCELAGVPAPLGCDGVSIAPLLAPDGYDGASTATVLSGPKTGPGSRRREFLIHEAGMGASIIRGDHKLIRLVPSKRKGKAVGPKKETYVLYDLARDHGEKRDIAADHPDLVEEMKALLLGERVTEPAGFATTYHHWTGGKGDSIGSTDAWSDYVYANDGITYIEEKGAPAAHWIATMANGTAAKAEGEFAVLALQVGGEKKQTLVVPAGSKVSGRNEIRITDNGVVELEGGTLQTLRWVNVQGMLAGQGTIEGGLELGGKLAPTGKGIGVAGDAMLGGELVIGEPLESVLQAAVVRGRFSNPDDRVVAADGSKWRIVYSGKKVTLKPAK